MAISYFKLSVVLFAAIASLLLVRHATSGSQVTTRRLLGQLRGQSTPSRPREQSASVLDALYKADKSKSYKRLVLRATPHTSSSSWTLDEVAAGSVSNATDVLSPLPPPADAVVPKRLRISNPGITFCLATTVDRLLANLPTVQHFSVHSNRIIVSVPNTEDEDAIRSALTNARAIGLNLEIRQGIPDDRFADRWWAAALDVAVSVARNPSDHTSTWYAFIDDDTFFPDITHVWDTLLRYPEPAVNDWYVGANAERLREDGFPHGPGGAGAFVSAALVKKLGAPDKQARCKEMEWAGGALGGDERLAKCLSTRLGVNVSTEYGLHQFDIWGNVDGVFETPGETTRLESQITHADDSPIIGAALSEHRHRLLSVHHWSRWFMRDIPSMATVGFNSGQRAIFHRYMIWDNSTTTKTPSFWIMTNGYSLVHYPPVSFSTPEDVQRISTATEETFDDYNRKWLLSFASTRPKNEYSQRYSFRLAIHEPRGSTGHSEWNGFFVHETDDAVDVIEVIWV